MAAEALALNVDTRPQTTVEDFHERTVYADGTMRVTLDCFLKDAKDRFDTPEGGWDAHFERETRAQRTLPMPRERTDAEVAKCPHKVRLVIWAGPDFRSPTHNVGNVYPTRARAVKGMMQMRSALRELGFDLGDSTPNT